MLQQPRIVDARWIPADASGSCVVTASALSSGDHPTVVIHAPVGNDRRLIILPARVVITIDSWVPMTVSTAAIRSPLWDTGPKKSVTFRGTWAMLRFATSMTPTSRGV